jgi:hypothetical protein
MHVVGSTNLNTTFIVCLAFLFGEEESDYTWGSTALQEILEELTIELPGVVVTDKDQALIKSVCIVFATAKPILCEWHVQMNVNARASIAFQTSEEHEIFMKEWAAVISSMSREEFDTNWNDMLDKYYISHNNSIKYLTDTWISVKYSLIRAWVDVYPHFGN